MIDKHSKKLLKELNTDMPDLPYGAFSFDYFGDALYDRSFASQIEYLVNNGYLQKTIINGQFTGYNLTHKGVHHKEMRRSELLSFLVKSVLVPVVVSFSTSILSQFFIH